MLNTSEKKCTLKRRAGRGDTAKHSGSAMPHLCHEGLFLVLGQKLEPEGAEQPDFGSPRFRYCVIGALAVSPGKTELSLGKACLPRSRSLAPVRIASQFPGRSLLLEPSMASTV